MAMTEERKEILEWEKASSLRSLLFLRAKLDRLTQQRAECMCEYTEWKSRYERADMELALETKLIKVDNSATSPSRSLKTILTDREKSKKLLTLIREEMSGHCPKGESMAP